MINTAMADSPHRFVLGIWAYMLIVFIVFGGTGCLLSSNLSALIPIGILSVLVGIAGTMLTYLRILGVKSDDPSDRTTGL
jgi:hypothetical protein